MAGPFKPLIVCESDPPYDHHCGFNDLVLLGQNVVYNLIIIGTLLFSVILVFAGFKLLTSGGKVGAKDEVKKMLWGAVKGFLWMLAAWLIIYTISKVLLSPTQPSPLIGNPQSNPTLR